MKTRAPLAVLIAAAAFAASAQQLYRWTDEAGRVHVTDTPPPASAANVQGKRSGSSEDSGPAQPYELKLAIKENPVTLYTIPDCNEPCAAARALLNNRGVPFREVQVHDEATLDELKRVAGGDDVPTLVVGRMVHRGFAQAGFDALLDAARYPRAGLLPRRKQGEPPLPEGYQSPAERARAEPAPEPPRGPYAPKPSN